MKRTLAILLTIIIALNGGCVFDNEKDTEQGEYLDSYFPLNPNLTRNYLVTTFINGSEKSDTMTRIFNGTAIIHGNGYYILKSKGSSEASYYRIENDILFRYYPENDKIYVPHSHEEPILDFTMLAGESWLVVSNTIVEEDQKTVYTLTSTFIGTETVQVPGGIFHDCARYDNHETWVYTYISEEDQMPVEMTMTYSAWYSRGIGLVKATAEGEFFGDYIIELSEYFVPD